MMLHDQLCWGDLESALLGYLRPEDVSVPEEDCGEADACLQ